MSTEHETPLELALARFLDNEPEPGDGAALAAAMEADPHLAEQVRRLLILDDLLRQVAEPDPAAFTESVQVWLAAQEDASRFTQAVHDRLTASPDLADTPPKGAPIPTITRTAYRFFGKGPLLALAVVLLFALGGGIAALLNNRQADPGERREIAWIINAQNCRWQEGGGPAGDMDPGKVLHLEQGLVELGFRSGTALVLKGPASLELQSDNKVRLLSGSLVARVPEPARGFEVLSPQGKLVDLGTEFGVNVGKDRSVEISVFRGEVQAEPAGKAPHAAPVSIREQQLARLNFNSVTFTLDKTRLDTFVRAIVPPPAIIPRTLALDFRKEVKGTLQDVAGLGTGLTHRLPGTGQDLPVRDSNLRLDRALGWLELTATRSDLNGKSNLSQGECVGVRLSDLGFTGREDFSVTAVIPNIPVLATVDQLGLYAGVRSDRNIRGGLHRPGDHKGEGPARQFFVHNNGGTDSQLYMVGLVSVGAHLRLTLKRAGGKYTLTIENHTSGTSCTLAIPHPSFLENERDLYVGLFAATPWRQAPKTIFVQELKVTVWTLSSQPGQSEKGG